MHSRHWRKRGRSTACAETVTGSEDDDWIKLRFLMELEGAQKLADLHPDMAHRWPERMATHERLRLTHLGRNPLAGHSGAAAVRAVARSTA